MAQDAKRSPGSSPAGSLAAMIHLPGRIDCPPRLEQASTGWRDELAPRLSDAAPGVSAADRSHLAT